MAMDGFSMAETAAKFNSLFVTDFRVIAHVQARVLVAITHAQPDRLVRDPQNDPGHEEGEDQTGKC